MAIGDSNYYDIYKYLGDLTGTRKSRTSGFRDVYGGFKEGRAGGGIGFGDLFKPVGTGRILGTIAKSFGFGGGGSRTNKMARQYMALVNQFESGFLKPTMKNLTAIKRINAPSFRVGSESFRSVFRQFEGAGKSLRDMVGGGDFGSIAGKMSRLSDLAKRVQKVLGGRGAGPDQPISSISGIQKIPVPSGELERPVLNLPGAIYGGFSPVQSEGHRFPVTTTQTPGGTRNRKSNLMKTPGILT